MAASGSRGGGTAAPLNHHDPLFAPSHRARALEEEEQQPLFDNHPHHIMLPPRVSSRLPTARELVRTLTGAIVCAAVCVAAVWLAAFLGMCVLLSWANTPEVQAACPGFWDFMLASVFAPLAIPCLYCAVVCCLWVAWQPFYGACSLVMAVACLHMSLTASESGACVEALRRTSEPLPWLLYAAYIKGALFTAAAATSLMGVHPPPPSSSASTPAAQAANNND
jgi:hypothetical protein